jgi:hypothetical protein
MSAAAATTIYTFGGGDGGGRTVMGAEIEAAQQMLQLLQLRIGGFCPICNDWWWFRWAVVVSGSSHSSHCLSNKGR